MSYTLVCFLSDSSQFTSTTRILKGKWFCFGCVVFCATANANAPVIALDAFALVFVLTTVEYRVYIVVLYRNATIFSFLLLEFKLPFV